MKKIKNEAALLKKAIEIGEKYASNRGYKEFGATDSAKEKVESLYRLLVHDILRHRLILTYEAEAEGVDTDKVIERLIQVTPIA